MTSFPAHLLWIKDAQYSTWLEKAEAIAREAHKGQSRLGGEPYISHPEAVVKNVGDDDALQGIAWLHDVVEDICHARILNLERFDLMA